jgi:Tfp pilus assembly protein PilF/mono/diheme cytochrome c family protein
MKRRASPIFLIVLLIALCQISQASAQDNAKVTFNNDIAPIIFKHCLACHVPGTSAPFSLLTYAEVRLQAKKIVEATEKRYMPPWKPSKELGGPFVGERSLSEEDIAKIATWVAQGTLEGDQANSSLITEPPVKWRLGIPDLVVTMLAPYMLPATGQDVFRNFVLPIPVSESKYVAGLEFKPGNQNIHHATLRIDNTKSSRELDEADSEPGYNGMLADRAHFPDGHFLGWTPGKRPNMTPNGLAWRLDPGTDLVLQAHAIPTGRPATLKAEVGFYFTETPPIKKPALIRLSSANIDIKAGEKDVVVEDRYTLPVDLDVLGIYPHAHYLGRRIESFAELPNGSTHWLLLIEDWDFDWQDDYRYINPVFLPKGSTVVMRFTFDNTSDNPRNPHTPPQHVSYGPASTDEMAELTLLARDPNDHVSHTSLGARYFEKGNVALALQHLEKAVKLDPTFASAEHNLATALMHSGRPQEALEHYRRAIELKPDYSQAHNNLGGLLQSIGELSDAMRHYRLAIRFQPRHADAHYNLANVLRAEGRLDEAIAHYRASLEIEPEVSRTRDNLARALALQGKWSDAITEYRKTLERNPSLVTSLVDLSWLLSTSPEETVRKPAEAVRLAKQATGLTDHANLAALDALAAAYAANEHFDQAVETAQKAVSLARQINAQDLEDDIQKRLQLYLSKQPFRMTP